MKHSRSLFLLIADIAVFVGIYLGLLALFHRPPIPITAGVLLALFLFIFWYHRFYRVEIFCNRLLYASRVLSGGLAVFVIFWGIWWFLLKTEWPEASRLLLVGLILVFGGVYALTLRLLLGKWLLNHTRVWYRLSGGLLDSFNHGMGRGFRMIRSLDDSSIPEDARGGLIFIEYRPSATVATRAEMWREYVAFLYRIKDDATRTSATVLVFNPYNRELNHEGAVVELNGIQGLAVEGSTHRFYRKLAKPLLDRFAALMTLPVLVLLFPLIAIMVRLQFGSPILFRQIRLGRAGRLFPLLKYRTMQIVSGSKPEDVDPRHHEYIHELLAEEERTALDPDRLVPVARRVRKLSHRDEINLAGAILRKTSLDELPQILNVLVGHMSLVGPRPALPYEIEMYPAWAKKRLHAPQGLTGLWQVSGRGVMPLHTALCLDVYYVLEHDFWLDLLILFRTLRSVFVFSRVY